MSVSGDAWETACACFHDARDVLSLKLDHAGESVMRIDRVLLLASCAAALPAAAVAQSVERLPEVVVSASRVPLPADAVGSAVTVIEGPAIRSQETRVLADVLREVPGVALSRSGPVGSITQVRIRGAEGNQTLVLIDGIEVNDPSGANEFDLSTVLAEGVERVEVLRGPQSALYGSDSIGGVINIITKKGKGPLTLSGQAEGGSFETFGASAAASGAIGAFDYALTAAGLTTEGVSTAPKSEGNTEKDGYENRTASAKFGWRATDFLEFEVVGRIVDSEVESDPQPAVPGVIRVVDGDILTTSDQLFGRAEAKLTLLDGTWEQLFTVTHAQDDQDTFTNGVRNFVADGAKTRLAAQTNLFFETPAYEPATHGLTFMVEREYESQSTRSLFGNSDLDIANNGFVAEYRVGVWDRLFVSISGRYDDNDIFKDAATFRATASYSVPESGTRLHGSFGEGVKNPTLFELFGFGPNFVPNPNLRPESSEGFDLGVEQQLFGGRATLDVTYFQNRITDLIQGAGNTSINLPGTTEINGIEVSLSADLTKTTRLRGQFTYTDGEDAAGQKLIRRPTNTASLNLTQEFWGGRAKADLAVDYHGEQEDILFSNFFINQSRITLDDYVLVNLAGSVEVLDGVELFGRIENLLDEDYQDVFGFANPGIGAFVGLRARFGPS